MKFQDVWRGRPAVREEEVDPLFRGSDGHHLLRGAVGVRPRAGRGRGDEQVSGPQMQTYEYRDSLGFISTQFGFVNGRLTESAMWRLRVPTAAAGSISYVLSVCGVKAPLLWSGLLWLGGDKCPSYKYTTRHQPQPPCPARVTLADHSRGRGQLSIYLMAHHERGAGND